MKILLRFETETKADKLTLQFLPKTQEIWDYKKLFLKKTVQFQT